MRHPAGYCPTVRGRYPSGDQLVVVGRAWILSLTNINAAGPSKDALTSFERLEGRHGPC